MPPAPDQAPRFSFLLGNLFRLVRHDFELRVSALGLTMTQWRAIAYLSRQEGIHQTALAEMLEVSPITLTRLIDRMEKAGWVERRPDPADRRAACLHLTARVQPLLDTMHAKAAETNEAALAGLSEQARARLLKTLERIEQNLRAAQAAATNATSAGERSP